MLRKVLAFVALGLFVSMQVSIAQETQKEENKKLQLTPYGFIKGDMFYATDGVYSWGNQANNYITTPQFASGVEESAISFTAQHTRLGLKGVTGEKVKVGGLVEIDFYNGPSDANLKPRIRLGYASIAKDGFEARFGQQWDLFSPNNANTVNTNGNMWFAGNMGFRRAQIQLSYTTTTDFVDPMIQVSFGEGAREEAGLGKDNRSGSPMIQARLSGKFDKKYVVGVSFATAAFKELKGTTVGPNVLAEDFTFNTTGIGLDFNLPFDKYFSLLGEFNTGTNLNNGNLFSAAGNYYYTLDAAGKPTEYDRKSTGFWLNATSQVTDWMTVVIGYGMDNNSSDDFNLGAVEKNSMLYGDFIFPLKHGFSVALEVENLATTVVTGVDASNKITTSQDNKATVIGLSGRVTF
ncbi:MAG: hypothetical protein IH598_01920 [Bacteroidales bacterium]|nr:hypothetical protein [Bacteroidales bacterium]